MSQHSFRQIKDWPQLRFASSDSSDFSSNSIDFTKTLVRVVLGHFIERI